MADQGDMISKTVAFYAPIKPPDHPIPSGDREIARNLIRALHLAGHEVRLESEFIAYMKRADEELFQQKRMLAKAEAERIIDASKSSTSHAPPDLWLTYHPYCKAPDWIGPEVSRALQIPYATVEACRTSREDHPVWRKGREHVQACAERAAINFCLKPTDRVYLESFLSDKETIFDLAPFIDTKQLQHVVSHTGQIHFANDYPVLIAVGMMRPGKKQYCYEILAKALSRITEKLWNIIIVGDGPTRPMVEELFSFVPRKRIRMTGALKNEEVISCLSDSDVFVWPGYREPIGMVYLEAGAMGLPVVALDSMGVPNVIRDGESGILVAEDDVEGLANGIACLVDDPTRRADLGAFAKLIVERHHDIAVASTVLSNEIIRITSQ